jgi:mono/diheme cytochrome c family protein
MKILITVLVTLAVVAGGILAYIWTGRYNVSATAPHWDITSKLLETARHRSITAHSKEISVNPSVSDPQFVEKGLHHFHPMCRLCHGAPGYQRFEFAVGLYPNAPDLASEHIRQEWNDAELFWIVKNGLKMTGMPSFGATHGEEELWGIIALVKQLPDLQPQGYQDLVQSAGIDEENHDHDHDASPQGADSAGGEHQHQ